MRLQRLFFAGAKVEKRQPGGFFESVLSSFTDAVIILNGDGLVQWLNNAAEQLSGHPLSQSIGNPFSSVFTGADSVRAIAEKVMSEGASLTNHDASIKDWRGESVPVDVSAYPVIEGDRRLTAIILRDITALKALERLMAVQDRLAELSTLAAGIAHEIKNPLGGIRGAAQLLGAEAGGGLREYTDLIIRESDRINRLVLDLINVNQPDEFKKEPQNIYPALDDVLRILRLSIESKDIKIVKLFDPSLPFVPGDGDRLRQIFLNLVKNAVEACQSGGNVMISTSLAWKAPRLSMAGKRGRFIHVEITDNGMGMDEETLAKLFTPFFSRKKGGSGLGLSMTLHLVQAHDGSLEIHNRTEGTGVTASVYFPFIT